MTKNCDCTCAEARVEELERELEMAHEDRVDLFYLLRDIGRGEDGTKGRWRVLEDRVANRIMVVQLRKDLAQRKVRKLVTESVEMLKTGPKPKHVCGDPEPKQCGTCMHGVDLVAGKDATCPKGVFVTGDPDDGCFGDGGWEPRCAFCPCCELPRGNCICVPECSAHKE